MMVEKAPERGETMDNSALPFPPASLCPLIPLDADAEFDWSLSNQSSASPPLHDDQLQQQTKTEAGPSHVTCPPSENESPDGMIMVPPAEDKASVHSHPLPMPPGGTDQYCHMIEILTQQQQRCLYLGQQFSHMGELTETARFESLAEECRIHIEVVKEAQRKGHLLPPYHTEERTFKAYRIVPSLSGSDMVLTIVKGINLPVPTGGSSEGPNPLCEKDYLSRCLLPTLQKHSNPISHKGLLNLLSICHYFLFNIHPHPEFNEHFKLYIKRGHRGFKRVIQSKGIKFEVVQKGGLFKTDKVIGSAVMKLDSLERQCESRQLIEVMNRREVTRAHLEVQVKIREPLGGPQFDILSENWLTMDPLSLPTMAVKKHTPQNVPVKKLTSSSSVCSVL
ncbi:coiled-coil and C2 domain-containing protein 1A isoform X1 [Esox lucius]|uniref:coiled-coil and C2 domain-containing protein 1A isoform X1 n=1 Tax=Esox lucius TaxID=8010 RepID=UPI0014768583|nr:coiled-coil and C2 domain-containing protein 1A isoform X1 [Esox lucius]XP_034151109.1 coiled-coil and C2 domain-containing protein 1A isoform X1 [Esox lucius]